MPRQSRRQRVSPPADPLCRRPRLELLEDRRLLANVTVGNLNHVVNGDIASIVALVADHGGDGISLREAVLAANADNTDAADVIDFGALAGTIPLTDVNHAGEIVISSNLAINGPGAGMLVIQAFAGTAAAGDGARIFNIDDGVADMVRDVAISGLTLTGGDAPGSGGAILARENLSVAETRITANATRLEGGGIYAAPASITSTFVNSLSIIKCLITGNAASRSEGGGIRKQTGSLIIEGSTISDNVAMAAGGVSVADNVTAFQARCSTFSNNFASTQMGLGGAILAYNVDNVSITDCQIIGNKAWWGGGVYLQAIGQITTASISGSAISDNSATFGGGGVSITNVQVTVASTTIARNVVSVGSGGGGIRSVGAAAASLSVIDSEVSKNSTKGNGGGISGTNVTVIGSTISGNSASSRGGGIHASGTLVVRHTTVTGNTAETDAGGILADGGAMLTHAIVAGNFRSASVASDIAGNATLSYSLLGVNTGASITDQGGNLIGTTASPIDPTLGPLADNGGPTMTHALLPGSPAIDAGDPNFNPGDPDGNPLTDDALPYDQRGFAFSRVVGGRIDMSAFEAGAVSADFDEDLEVDGLDFLAWQRGFGSTGAAATSALGNADLDGDVDGDDLATWKLQFGSPPVISAAAVQSSVLTSADHPSLALPIKGREPEDLTGQRADAVFASFDLSGLFAAPEDFHRAKRRLLRR